MAHRPPRSALPLSPSNLEYAVIARKPPAPPSQAAAPRKRAASRAKIVVPVTVAATPGTPRKKAAAAGPAPKVKRSAGKRGKPSEPSRLDALQKIIVDSLDDDKAENIVAIDLEGRASFADRMVIATGLADRQISAMATHLEEKLEKAGLKRLLIEGAAGADWVLLDAGDIIVHLFKADARELYGLEKMWGAELDDLAATAPAQAV